MNSIQTVSNKAFSNIALVKYWGKTGRQYPLNPSLSMLIPQCYSSCEISFEFDEKNPGVKSFLFENMENEVFSTRIKKYLRDIEDVYPLTKKLSLAIKTSNNFPHSAGIASSASAFAALAKCLTDIEISLGIELEDAQKRSSMLARLGSGSACRSLTSAEFNLWGKTLFEIGSNDYGTDLKLTPTQQEKLGWPLLDTILIVSSATKKVSSSQGHALMHTHPYREARIEQANENMRVLYQAIMNGDPETFGEIVENEAMSLHALMMSSYPAFCLLLPNSLAIIEKVQTYRRMTGLNLYFTIDAGPNIHLIYPEKQAAQINLFIQQELSPLCETIFWGQSYD